MVKCWTCATMLWTPRWVGSVKSTKWTRCEECAPPPLTADDFDDDMTRQDW